MLRRSAAAALASVLVASAALPAAPPPHPALARGLALVREGDFEAAVIELDGAVRRLEADPAAAAHVPWAWVHLGVAYLELDQETVARGKFREALLREPALRLDPAEFSAQSIRVFESVRAEAGAAPRVEPAAPGARATPAPPREEKGSSRGLVLVLAGGGAAAGAGVGRGGGGGGGGAATTTTTAPVGGGGPSTTTPSPSPTPSEPPATTPPTTQPATPEPPSTTLPAACRYNVDNLVRVPLAGCIGCQCSVTAEPAGCRWTAQASDPGMVQITVGQGTGNGNVVFNVTPSLAPRSSRITLVQGGGACTVSQAVLLDGPRPPGW
jgi:hypothetical protein